MWSTLPNVVVCRPEKEESEEGEDGEEEWEEGKRPNYFPTSPSYSTSPARDNWTHQQLQPSVANGRTLLTQERQLLLDTYTEWAHWRKEASAALTDVHFALYKKLQEVEFGLPQALKNKICTKRQSVWAY